MPLSKPSARFRIFAYSLLCTSGILAFAGVSFSALMIVAEVWTGTSEYGQMDADRIMETLLWVAVALGGLAAFGSLAVYVRRRGISIGVPLVCLLIAAGLFLGFYVGATFCTA